MSGFYRDWVYWGKVRRDDEVEEPPPEAQGFDIDATTGGAVIDATTGVGEVLVD